MKKMSFLLISLTLLPTACWAIRHPSCKLTNIARVVKGEESPEYQQFLSQQVEALLGGNSFIPFSDLMNNSYFKREFAGLSAAEEEKLEAISKLGDSPYDTDWEIHPETAPGLVSARELLVMLIVLDASIVKDATGKAQLVLDTYPTLGAKGWLSILSDSAMKKLMRDTISSPIVQEVRQQGEDAQTAAKLQKLQVFNQDGSLNRDDAAEAMSLLGMSVDGDLSGLAEIAFGDQLESARETGMRDGGGAVVVLKDGTTLTKRNMSYTVTIAYPGGRAEELDNR